MPFTKTYLCWIAMTAFASAYPWDSYSGHNNLVISDNSSSCTGSTSNGECCPYGTFDNSSKKCCPYGNILGDNCCITGSTKSWGNVISSGTNRDCPKDSISIALDSSNYSSLVASAIKKVGATASAAITASGADSTIASDSSSTTTASDDASSSPSDSSPSTSTSTGLAAHGTGSIPLAMIVGAGAMLI